MRDIYESKDREYIRWEHMRPMCEVENHHITDCKGYDFEDYGWVCCECARESKRSVSDVECVFCEAVADDDYWMNLPFGYVCEECADDHEKEIDDNENYI